MTVNCQTQNVWKYVQTSFIWRLANCREVQGVRKLHTDIFCLLQVCSLWKRRPTAGVSKRSSAKQLARTLCGNRSERWRVRWRSTAVLSFGWVLNAIIERINLHSVIIRIELRWTSPGINLFQGSNLRFARITLRKSVVILFGSIKNKWSLTDFWRRMRMGIIKCSRHFDSNY